jgi:hypothetical protein
MKDTLQASAERNVITTAAEAGVPTIALKPLANNSTHPDLSRPATMINIPITNGITSQGNLFNAFSVSNVCVGAGVCGFSGA